MPMCPRCGAEHPRVFTTATLPGSMHAGRAEPDERECWRAARRQVDALEAQVADLRRALAIAGPVASSVVGG